LIHCDFAWNHPQCNQVMDMGIPTERELEAQVLSPHLSSPEKASAGYDALHGGAGWLDLSNRGKIVVRGPDRVRIVDSLVSNDVQGLQSGGSCYAFFLNQQGYVLADAHIACLREEILIDTEPELRIKLLGHIKQHTVPRGVQFEDVTERLSTISVEGPQAAEVVARAGFPVPGAPYEILETPAGWLGRLNTTGQDGFFFFVPSVRKYELVSRIEAAGAVQASGDDMRTVRIERGKPRYGEEITEQYLAEETGLCHALDFQKDPYLGRRAVNDLHSDGQLKKLLVLVSVGTSKLNPPCINLFFANQPCGQLVSSAYSPTYRNSVGLAYVAPYLASTGVELLCQDATRVTVHGRIDTGISSCDHS
jgi:glycine cleavage system aminomethyltransferase T